MNCIQLSRNVQLKVRQVINTDFWRPYHSIFAIQEIDGVKDSYRFVYPGDSINYVIDLVLVDLYDVFRDLVF